MYIFEVEYQVKSQKFYKSYLLSKVTEGFYMKNHIQGILAKKHNREVTIISTELEEL
ncbi:hypothetical protein [Bacillus manliponensis]|uniref:hypothetical protein n=1 Tax=Bacillus manliponensis TaxID=574376 RepID=UPI000AFA0F83|nr:hypothetical protein [Bacillus manliponensis]